MLKTVIFWLEFTYLSEKAFWTKLETLDAEFGPLWKDRKGSYQNVAHFCNLVVLILSWNCVKSLVVTRICKKIKFDGELERVRSKKLFPETIMDKIFETNSAQREKFYFYFSALFWEYQKKIVLGGRLGTTL